MKFYLSSYKLGNQTEKLVELIPNGKIAYIPNALDFSNANLELKKKNIEEDISLLKDLGIEVELLDLQNYFHRKEELEDKVTKLGAVFVRGGNVFVLRQSMKLSGFDQILQNLSKNQDFLYAAYSAGVCVLSEELKAYEIVDNACDTSYNDLDETIWEGVNLINFTFMPHWKSDHPESADIDKAIEYCEKNRITYKALRDGEVIIIQ